MGSLVVGGARTPFGRLGGALASLPATELGGVAVAAALQRAGVPPEAVDHVVLGQVLPAGAGQLPARQAAVRAGIGMDVPALTVNKVCLSGLNAVALADQLIRAGECEVVVAGGMESMTQAPHLLPGSRQGYRYGDVTVRDHMAHDGLWDVWTDQSMGALTESCNTGPLRVGREEQDAFAVRSHRLAAQARASGVLDPEVVAVTVPGRRGATVVDEDEGVRPDADEAALARLRPAFAPDGTITAGSASPISDGAAACVVMSPAAAERWGATPLAEVVGYGQVAGPDSSLQLQPAAAVRAACRRAGVEVADLDLLELNEAFAAVVLASARDLGLDPEQVERRVNVHGGAIALGHPIGASGARLVLHLALELSRRGTGLGVAALCGGGGQGDALLLRAAGPA
ncbi:acetyl-CoA C-acyltransferase [Auraticoccus sp. F435]|uniref:Probable acetyl-CoA acetyltransferase n=1 Tax=Auraticoccus cholistanensis TaxID=2656650 RepID=A0A6A9UTN0_9ACTN|nr:acetyl-CoA C-acetyltransferase [Auraticoccus cholistanensis]MVA76031.1 acetyl-CoA C-acyltransferase [Auraticoccus cholistanensis]